MLVFNFPEWWLSLCLTDESEEWFNKFWRTTVPPLLQGKRGGQGVSLGKGEGKNPIPIQDLNLFQVKHRGFLLIEIITGHSILVLFFELIADS